MVLLTKQQAALAGLEKHFDIQTMAVDANDVILAKAHVRANYGNPILAVVTVADTDDAGIYAIFAIFVLVNFYSCGQEIPGTAPAFLAGGKNLLDVHGFSLKEVESFAAAFTMAIMPRPIFLISRRCCRLENQRSKRTCGRH